MQLKFIVNTIVMRQNGALISRTFAVIIAIALMIFSTSSPANALDKGSVQGHQLMTPASIVSEFFIATSAEYSANPSQIWTLFVERVQRHSVYSCMIDFGFKPRELQSLSPTSPASLGVDNIDYPDVQRLKEGKLGLVSIPYAKEKLTVPATEVAAFRSDLGKCNARPLTMLAPVNRLLDPMVRAWSRDIGMVSQSEPVVEATKRWSACVALRGVPAASLQNWFARLDGVIQASAGKYSDPYSAPEVVARVKVYGDCVATVARAMDDARFVDRVRLLDVFGRELPTLAQKMNEIMLSYVQRGP